jgi:hypothetical protein
MKKFVLAGMILAGAIGFGVRAQAQDAPKEHSMTGCLAKGSDAGTFMLTNVEKGPKEVVIAETTAKLDPHVGHKVEITGSAMKGAEGAHTMKVSAVKMLGATCP